MRRFWFIVLLLCSLAGAQPAAENHILVLVHPNSFNPQVNPDTFSHPYWVKWPAPARTNGSNRILSVATGIDWIGTESDLDFHRVPRRAAWRSINVPHLWQRGHFRARAENLREIKTTLLLNPSGGTRSEALLITLEEGTPEIRGFPLKSSWPEGHLMVVASDGRDISALRQRTAGRVLVVEYPPRLGESWSRMWLYGSPWPSGLPRDPDVQIPGAIDAKRLLPFLQTPQRLNWSEAPANWTGANRWFSYRSWSKLLAMSILGVAGLLLSFFALRLIGQERRNELLPILLRLYSLSPASLLLGGALTPLVGTNGGPGWSLIVLLLLGAITWGLDLYWPRDPWKAPAWITAAAVATVGPLYTAYWSEYGFAVSGGLLGCLYSGLVILACSTARFSRKGEAAALVAAAALAGYGYLTQAWWASEALTLWPVLLTMSTIRFSRRWFLPLAVLLSPGLYATLLNGFSFAPRGLHLRADDLRAVNLAEHLVLLLSPGVAGAILITLGAPLFGSTFLGHELVRGWRVQVQSRCLFRAAGICAVGGILFPPLLEAALWCYVAGGIVLMEFLVRPAEPLSE